MSLLDRLYTDCLNARVLGVCVWCSVRVAVRSEVGLGLLCWCNYRYVPQIEAVVFCTGSSVLNPAPIIGLFSSSPSSNKTYYIRGVQQEP